MNVNEIKVGCIGSGMMGGALMQAVAKNIGGEKIFVSDADFEKAKAFAKKIDGTALETNKEIVEKCDVVFLAVKPAYINDVLEEIKYSLLRNQKILVSMAAGVKLESIKDSYEISCSALKSTESDGYPPHLIRIMPNLPATVGEAMIALAPDSETPAEEASMVKELLSRAGKVEIVAEKLMDAVTAVSGSGPAYAFLFIEALADAAVRFGIPRSQAYTYAAQTLRGAATLALEDGRSISELKDAVCSPAGTTIEGVIALERNGFRNAVIEAATAAYDKSVELGKK